MIEIFYRKTTGVYTTREDATSRIKFWTKNHGYKLLTKLNDRVISSADDTLMLFWGKNIDKKISEGMKVFI